LILADSVASACCFVRLLLPPKLFACTWKERFRQWYRERNAISFEIQLSDRLVHAEREGRICPEALQQLVASKAEPNIPIAA